MATLPPEAVRERLKGLPGWSVHGASIEKQFTFASFPDAVAFVARLAFGAEMADHHPDITINYKRVTLSYSTHSAGGITQRDFDGAETAERCAT